MALECVVHFVVHHVPPNSSIVLRATNSIKFNAPFDLANTNANGTYNGKGVTTEMVDQSNGSNENLFTYDAIGNLIGDVEQGVAIEWTPYGKVRKVTKGDGSTLTFRYDATGNRLEKKMQKADGTGNVTRYVRDASGNVMATYSSTLAAGVEGASVLIEQPIYGSSRLGLYKGGRTTGEQKLGTKNYELSNHLGNVLTVITDNIRLQADSAWATVVNARDYYAFGSEMPNRSFTSSTYRYGFNGKEKDTENTWGDAQYDYGFRIYNPKIGKFLSVDPLTKSYPWYTPYQFAGNKPIIAVDLDGLEEKEVITTVATTTTATVLTKEAVGKMTYEQAIRFVGGNAPRLIPLIFQYSPLVLLTLQGDDPRRKDFDKSVEEFENHELQLLERRIERDGCIGEGDVDRYIDLMRRRRGAIIQKDDIYKKVQMGPFQPKPFGIYDDSEYSKHGNDRRGDIAARPLNGQEALNNSFLVKQKRAGFSQRISVEGDHFVVLDEQRPGVFHGHQRDWNELSQDQKNTLIKNKVTDVKGRLIKNKD